MGLTQGELANLINIQTPALSAIETGRNSLPPKYYIGIAEALEFDKKNFAKFLLRYTNPIIYFLMFGPENKALTNDIEEIKLLEDKHPRLKKNRPKTQEKKDKKE